MPFPLGNFLNQSVSYQQWTGINDRDDATYNAAVTVPARFADVEREKYAKTEDVHQVRAKVWLAFEPALHSLINNREIIELQAMVCVDGSNPGWVATLR